MREDLANLAALQRVDSRIGELTQSLANLDDGTELGRKIRGAERKLELLGAEKRQREGEIQTAEQTAWRLDERAKQEKQRLDRGETKGHKEAQETQAHIDNLAQQKRRSDDSAIVAMGDIERINEEIAELTERVAKAKRRLGHILETKRLETARLSQEIAQAREERAVAAAPVPATLLRQYDAIRQRKGVEGLVWIADPLCPACLTALSPMVFERLAISSNVHVCENCGRILYREDE